MIVILIIKINIIIIILSLLIKTLKYDNIEKKQLVIACMHAITHEWQGLQFMHACAHVCWCVCALVCMLMSHL